MKLRVFKHAVLLLLGVVINVVVAWSCAVWSVGAELYDIDFNSYRPVQVKPHDERWLRANGWNTPQGESLTFGNLRAFGYFRVEYFSIPSKMFDPSKRINLSGGRTAVVAQTSCGWPFFSLRAEEWLDSEAYKRALSGYKVIRSEKYEYIGGIPIAVEVDIGGPVEMVRILPYLPIWAGFAINTVFYGTLLWLLTLGPRTARRIIRRKLGHCIKCAYNLRGDFSTGCPECGWQRNKTDKSN